MWVCLFMYCIQFIFSISSDPISTQLQPNTIIHHISSWFFLFFFIQLLVCSFTLRLFYSDICFFLVCDRLFVWILFCAAGYFQFQHRSSFEIHTLLNWLIVYTFLIGFSIWNRILLFAIRLCVSACVFFSVWHGLTEGIFFAI